MSTVQGALRLAQAYRFSQHQHHVAMEAETHALHAAGPLMAARGIGLGNLSSSSGGHRYTQSTAASPASSSHLQPRAYPAAGGAQHLQPPLQTAASQAMSMPNGGGHAVPTGSGAAASSAAGGHRRFPSASPSVTSLLTTASSGGTLMQSGTPAITDLAFMQHTTSIDVPPPLAGGSMTVLHDPRHPDASRRVYLFGGRLVSTRKMTNELYSLDMKSFAWHHHREEDPTLSPPPAGISMGGASAAASKSALQSVSVDEHGTGPPNARYFHSANLYSKSSLVIFGGMGQRRVRDGQDTSVVLNDVHILELLPPASPHSSRPATRASETARPGTAPRSNSVSSDRGNGAIAASVSSLESPKPLISPSASQQLSASDIPRVRWRRPAILGTPPAPRYAHLTAICGHQLLVVGGQDILNNYLEDAHLFDLRTFTWLRRVDFPRHCGVYRSILEVSEQRAYVYSNYNFTEVKRELQVIDPLTMSLQDHSTSMHGDVLPPGLRFPVGSRSGQTLIISGTYLTNTTQSFSIWRLDLPTLTWSRLSTARQLDKGSWNRAVLDVAGDRYLIFGHRTRQLMADYEHRRVNFEHVVEMRLDAYGVYEDAQPIVSPVGRELGLALWADPRLSDFEIRARAPADAPPVRVNASMLRRRWSFLDRRLSNQERNPALPRARAVTLHAGYDAVRGFVHYLHTLEIDPAQTLVSVLCGMLVLGVEYDVPGLSRAAAARLQGSISQGGPTVAWHVLVVARRAGHVGLRVRALRMLAGRDGVEWLESSPEFWSDAAVLAEAEASGGAWDSDDIRESRDEVLAYVGGVLQRRASADSSRISAIASNVAALGPGHGQSMSVSNPRRVVGVGQQVARAQGAGAVPLSSSAGDTRMS